MALLSSKQYHSLKNLQRTLALGKKLMDTDWSAVELVSIHIPKTAGTSFFEVLQQNYTKRKVVRIDIDTVKEPTINKVKTGSARIYPNPRVIHGHFSPQSLHSFIQLNDAIPTITWLRNPIDRVISNYFYLRKIMLNLADNSDLANSIFDRIGRSLEDFASDPRQQNRMHRFMNGISLEDLTFIGLVENYDEDLKTLGSMFHWSYTNTVRNNVTGSRNLNQISEETRELIACCNQLDMELYQRGQVIRKNNGWTHD